MPSPNKKTIQMPAETLAEIKQEAERQERSVSWMLQRAWVLARKQIRDTRTPNP